jgi:hypothetical protein
MVRLPPVAMLLALKAGNRLNVKQISVIGDQ